MPGVKAPGIFYLINFNRWNLTQKYSLPDIAGWLAQP